VTLREEAPSIGKRIDELGLEQVGAEVTAVRRGRERMDASAATELAAGDVVVLRGSADAVTRAENLLLA
jgi:CPA2 family monovalent cation:H+ antiporter-2